MTEPSYFVKAGVVIGSHDLRRAKPFVAKDGSFVYARFKLRDHKRLARADGHEWSWNDNPFIGSHELNGLKILLMLTSNWDAKDARDGKGSNTSVYSKPGSADQLYYAFDDWGAAMGKWGGFSARQVEPRASANRPGPSCDWHRIKPSNGAIAASTARISRRNQR